MFEFFDPSDREHVEWLKKLVEADSLENKLRCLADNPMKQSFQAMDAIHVIFGLCTRYTLAVFDKTAFIL